MKPLSRSLLVLTLLGLSLTACSVFTVINDQAQPVGKGPTVLFQDDFSDLKSGWTSYADQNAMVGYDSGGFRIFGNVSHYNFPALTGLDLSDVHIDVDAAKVQGPDDNAIGIICRYQDAKNYYGLLISSDGYFAISKVKAGEQSLIGMETMQYSEEIHRGAELNHLQAECVGNTLRLFANGKKLVETQDVDFQSGDVGLLVGTFDTPGVDILFDNFIVSKP